MTKNSRVAILHASRLVASVCVALAMVSESVRSEPVSFLRTTGGIEVLSLEGSHPRVGGGPGSDEIQFSYSPEHAVAITRERDLVIDGLYYGRLGEASTVHFGYGRAWVDGLLRASEAFPPELEPRFFDDSGPMDQSFMFQTSEDGNAKFKVLCHEAARFGGGGNGGRLLYSAYPGPYAITIRNDGALSVWGIPYGLVGEGDQIDIHRDKVLVNDELRLPMSNSPQ